MMKKKKYDKHRGKGRRPLQSAAGRLWNPAIWKNEKINDAISKALKDAPSKSGGNGGNGPDIQLLLQDGHRRDIPVMIEAKGSRNRLEKLTRNGDIEQVVSRYKNPYSSIQNYAVNGALHYGLAILEEGTYEEVVVVGVNGTELKEGKVADPEVRAYYVSNRNGRVPKLLSGFDFSQIRPSRLDDFYRCLDHLLLTAEEKERLKNEKEQLLEKSVKDIHQKIYEDASLKMLLNTSEKLYLFCGLIMAGLKTKNLSSLAVSDLRSEEDEEENDGAVILRRTRRFLRAKNCEDDKVRMVLGYLKPVFEKKELWRPVNGESILRSVYRQVKSDIIPLLESPVHLDFTGRILNSLNDWVSIENDRENDVVLTPREVTRLMVRITQTNKDSIVWDTCMGSSGFLVAAMEEMIEDARRSISNPDELEAKIQSIKKNQLLGIEILGNVYILAVLNMILMGDGSSQIVCGDSRTEVPRLAKSISINNIPNIYLLNPPL